MSFPGDLWSSVNRIASQSKMNLKTILVGTGDQILAKSPTVLQVGQVAVITTNSSGGALQAGIVRWDGSNWINPSGGIHTHEGTGSGGSIQNILLKAVSNLWFANMINPSVGNFVQSGTGATFANVVSGTDGFAQISTGTTTNNHGALRRCGVVYSFAQPSSFIVRVRLSSSTTSATARIGMNMETADSVTNNKVKYGFEGCSTCNTTNMSIISSQGTTRSKNTSSTDNYSTVGNFIMQLNPGIDTRYRKETGTIIVKTTDVPSTGIPDRSNVFVMGLQTTNTTAKTLDFYGGYAIGTIGETGFPVIT